LAAGHHRAGRRTLALLLASILTALEHLPIVL
jgi:hypothetical protein